MGKNAGRPPKEDLLENPPAQTCIRLPEDMVQNLRQIARTVKVLGISPLIRYAVEYTAKASTKAKNAMDIMDGYVDRENKGSASILAWRLGEPALASLYHLKEKLTEAQQHIPGDWTAVNDVLDHALDACKGDAAARLCIDAKQLP